MRFVESIQPNAEFHIDKINFLFGQMTIGPSLSPLREGKVGPTASRKESSRELCWRLDSEFFRCQAQNFVTFVQILFWPQHYSLRKTDARV